MVFYTSTGLSNDKIMKTTKQRHTQPIYSACIIPTGLTSLKENHPISKKTLKKISENGYGNFSLIDMEISPPREILKHQLIIISGGNSNPLFYHFKKNGRDQLIISQIENAVPVVDASAGAFFLSSGNHHVDQFGKILEIDETFLLPVNHDGLKITNHILLPHYDLISQKVENLKNKLIAREKKRHITITTLKNNDFIHIDDHGDIHNHFS